MKENATLKQKVKIWQRMCAEKEPKVESPKKGKPTVEETRNANQAIRNILLKPM